MARSSSSTQEEDRHGKADANSTALKPHYRKIGKAENDGIINKPDGGGRSISNDVSCLRRNLADYIMTVASADEIAQHNILRASFENRRAILPHPGTMVHKRLNSIPISVNAAAASMEVASSQLSRLLKLQTNISPALALKLEPIMGESAEYMLEVQSNYDLSVLKASPSPELNQLYNNKSTLHGRVNFGPKLCHLGKIIEAIARDRGTTLPVFAIALGVSRQQLHKIVSGENRVSPEMALRLQYVVGGGAEEWLRAQGQYDIAQVRLMRPPRQTNKSHLPAHKR